MYRSRIPKVYLISCPNTVIYALVGIVFALPTTHVKAWRLAAWGISSVAYAAHIWHERFRLRNSVVAAALHVASAAALGAFGLALGANIHSLCLGSTAEHRRLLLLSLGLWPALVAVPAFLLALAVTSLLSIASSATTEPRR